MSKVKIDVPGWSHYNGLFGNVMFENGVSTRELTDLEIRRIGANIKIVAVDTDEQVGVTVDMNKNRHNAAVDVKAMPTTAEVNKEVERKMEAGELYTKEQLEALAEEKGIKAIREIAAKFEIKGVQISAMIDQILEKQVEGSK